MSPQEAATELARRVASLPAQLRAAAIAWLPSHDQLEREFGARSAMQPLRGVPFFVKDLFDVAGSPTNAGSPFLSSVRPATPDSNLVATLRELGAVVAGKSQMVEFAAGLTGENRTYGDCPHPHDPTRLSGGSSSGSAALVGAGVVPFALGSDTGGSVRVPAAFCGIHGFRSVPHDRFIRDAFPLSPTCDTAGWFTAGAADMRGLLRLLVGSTPASASFRGAFLTASEILPAADPHVDRACRAAAERFAAPCDHATRDALLASWRNAIDAYSAIVMHEANAIHRPWLQSHREHYDPAIWQRIVAGGNQDAAAIARARAEFTSVRETFARFFRTHDFLALPCAPIPALKKSEATPEARKAILTFTSPASLAGLPVLTLPVPLPSGLTAGLQIIAARPDHPVFASLL